MERWTPWGTQRQKQLVAAGDVVLALMSLALGIAARAAFTGGDPFGPAWPAESFVLALLVATQLGALYVSELYELSRPLRATMIAAPLVVTIASAAITAGIASLVGLPFSRIVLLTYVGGFSLGSLLWRLWIMKRRRVHAARERVLVLGGRRLIASLCEELAERPGGTEDFYWHTGEGGEGTGLDAEAVVELAVDNDVDIVTYPWAMHSEPAFTETVLKLHLAAIEVQSFPSFFGSRLGRVPLETIDDSWISETLGIAQQGRVFLRLQRLIEPAAALMLGLVTLPVAALVALVIKLDSRGPVLLGQERLGHLEKPFRLYKFRTMIADAEHASGPVWAAPDDHRITRVGWFLRATGLDEMPQLINIMRGEMSFLGVRPIRRHFAEKIAEEVPFYWHRFFVYPGVTGWAQVMHDYAGSVEGQRRKLEYELFYLRYASLTLDLAILLKTVKTVLFRRVGAFIESPRGLDGTDTAGDIRGSVEAGEAPGMPGETSDGGERSQILEQAGR